MSLTKNSKTLLSTVVISFLGVACLPTSRDSVEIGGSNAGTKLASVSLPSVTDMQTKINTARTASSLASITIARIEYRMVKEASSGVPSTEATNIKTFTLPRPGTAGTADPGTTKLAIGYWQFSVKIYTGAAETDKVYSTEWCPTTTTRYNVILANANNVSVSACSNTGAPVVGPELADVTVTVTVEDSGDATGGGGSGLTNDAFSLIAIPISASSVQLIWSHFPNVTDYHLGIDSTSAPGACDLSLIGDLISESKIFPNLPPNSHQYFQICAAGANTRGVATADLSLSANPAFPTVPVTVFANLAALDTKAASCISCHSLVSSTLNSADLSDIISGKYSSFAGSSAMNAAIKNSVTEQQFLWIKARFIYKSFNPNGL